MDHNEFYSLGEIVNQALPSVDNELILTFKQSYGIHDLSSLTTSEYLKYKLSEIENISLRCLLIEINHKTVTDPHNVILILQKLKDTLMTSPYIINLLSLLGEEINSIITDCKQIVKDTHKLSRKLNQSVQRNVCYKNFDNLIQTVEEFIKNYPLFNVARKAVTMVKKIIPYCDGKLLQFVMVVCEALQMMTHDYHNITTLLLPTIKLYIKLYKQISSSPDNELTYHYIMSGKFNEQEKLIITNHFIKLQEVAPYYVHKEASQYHYIH